MCNSYIMYNLLFTAFKGLRKPMPDFPDHSPNFSNPTAGNPGVPEKNAASKANDSQFDDKESNFDVAFLLSLAPNTRSGNVTCPIRSPSCPFCFRLNLT